MDMVKMNVQGDDMCSPCEYDPSPCVYLNSEQVEALGIKGMPAPGTVFVMQAHAVVSSMTASGKEADGDDDTDVTLSLKLVEMAIAPTGGDKASVLYGG